MADRALRKSKVTKAVWKKGKRIIEGWYSYNRAAENFSIVVKIRDTLTGESERRFTVYDDTPEWNGWKLQRPSSSAG